MKILLVDGNRSFARKIQRIVSDIAPKIQLDLATNIFETQLRLEKNVYILILINYHTVFQVKDVIDELDTVSAPKILWLMTTGTTYLPKLKPDWKTKLVNSPMQIQDTLTEALPMLVAQA